MQLKLVFMLFAAMKMVVADDVPELAPVDVLADQQTVPGPFSPENQEELANMVGVGDRVITGDVEDELLPGEEALIAAEPVQQPDKFYPMDERSPAVTDLVDQFMEQYEEEVGRTSLKASVLQILKAEKTEPREETQEIEIGTGTDEAMEIVENDVSQVMRVYLLVNYGFQTSMLDSKRPYVSVLELTMDCVNGTAGTGEAEDMECDILEHLDLPRRTGSAEEVGSAIQREIADAAPSSFLLNHTLKVQYDAVEMQDLAIDDEGDTETMTYVRYRVADNTGKLSDQDCMIVVQQARGINTLMYSDTVCFDSASKSAILSAYEYASNNLPMGALIFAALCGAVVGAVLLIRHRRNNQRFGYSYVRSKVPSHVPSQGTESGVKYIDSTSPATAC